MQTRSSASASANHRCNGKLQIMDPWEILPRWSSANGNTFPSQESVHRPLPRSRTILEDNMRVYEGSRTKQDNRSVEYASKGFRLPKGWAVEEIPRKNSNQIDKYYVDRKTGKRFRSLVSVERYLNESGYHKEKQHMLLQYQRSHSKDFSLPDGWIIEEKPRNNSSHIDKTYIETRTGNKFRSLVSVERYLQAVGNITVDSVSMLHSERLSLFVNRNDATFHNQVIDPKPPDKVKWVLTGPSGTMFTADVSSSVKQKWSEAFVALIQDRF